MQKKKNRKTNASHSRVPVRQLVISWLSYFYNKTMVYKNKGWYIFSLEKEKEEDIIRSVTQAARKKIPSYHNSSRRMTLRTPVLRSVVAQLSSVIENSEFFPSVLCHWLHNIFLKTMVCSSANGLFSYKRAHAKRTAAGMYVRDSVSM